MLITSFYCVAGKQYFYAKICSQKRATLAMQQDDGTARLRDNKTTGQRDHETTRLRDYGTTRRRDNKTSGLRDYETTGQQKNTGVLSRAWLRVAARGILASEWCSSVADKEIGLDG